MIVAGMLLAIGPIASQPEAADALPIAVSVVGDCKWEQIWHPDTSRTRPEVVLTVAQAAEAAQTHLAAVRDSLPATTLTTPRVDAVEASVIRAVSNNTIEALEAFGEASLNLPADSDYYYYAPPGPDGDNLFVVEVTRLQGDWYVTRTVTRLPQGACDDMMAL